MVNIEYIGWRPNHVDGYVRQTWEQTGAVHPVPASKAQIMLRKHPDVYRLAWETTEEDLAAAIDREGDKAAQIEEMREIEDQALRDQVTRMEKQQVIDFIQAKFGKRMDKRLSPDNLRREAVNMIDMYGLP